MIKNPVVRNPVGPDRNHPSWNVDIYLCIIYKLLDLYTMVWLQLHGDSDWCCRCKIRTCQFEATLKQIDRLLFFPVNSSSKEEKIHLLFRQLLCEYEYEYLSNTWGTESRHTMCCVVLLDLKSPSEIFFLFSLGLCSSSPPKYWPGAEFQIFSSSGTDSPKSLPWILTLCLYIKKQKTKNKKKRVHFSIPPLWNPSGTLWVSLCTRVQLATAGELIIAGIVIIIIIFPLLLIVVVISSLPLQALVLL